MIRTTEIFNRLSCNYCRLIYGEISVTIEAIVEASVSEAFNTDGRSPFKEIEFLAHHVGGEFRSQSSTNQSILQISLQLPYDGSQKVDVNEHLLSEREKEIISLLAQGLRDRDIAEQLHISESTVKFHLNGTLHKLKAKNRYQAIYQATVQGFI
ncbi:response regulator transcription factor [Synechocystis sp. B12]|nr:response regulator transcription factor [Synechocystis sp. B12]